MVNSCGYGNEHAGSIKSEEFFKLRDYTLHKGYVQWTHLLQLNKEHIFGIFIG